MLQWISQIWNRVTTPDSRRPRTAYWIPKTDAGVRVDHESAMTFSAVWACVRVISEAISQLPWRAMIRTSSGNEVLTTHPADRLLYRYPNEGMTPAVWRELIMHDVLLWGNTYCEIQRDGSGKPTGLYHISPDRVEPFMANVGGERDKLFYAIRNQDKEDDVLAAEDMFHLRGLGGELSGWSVIQNAAQAIGLGAAQDQSMSTLIANGSRPAGLITPAGSLNAAAAQRIVEEWESAYGGSKNKGKTALLSHQMQYTPLALPNTDAQLLESRRFSVIEICRFFRVPPHKVYDLERATFSNIEHQAIEFVQDTLVPWIVKLEQEANRKLIGPANQGQVFTKINVNALLRGDFASRASGYQMLFDRGVYSVNDILELEDRNTIGPDGDLRFVPLNFQTLEQAAEPPEPPAPPPEMVPVEPDEDDPEEETPTDSEMVNLYRPVLFDAVDRIVSREINLLKGEKTADKLGNGHAGYITNQLTPHVAAVLRLTGNAINVADWAAKRCERLRAEATGHRNAGGDWSELFSLWVDRVDADTDELMGVQHGS